MVKFSFSKKQLIESGIVLVIIFLVIGYYSKNNLWLRLSVLLLFIDLILPVIFYPMAIFWFNLSEILGTWISKILLGIVFFFVICPVGIIRKKIRINNLLLKHFKKNDISVFKTKNHTYNSEDLIIPY